MGNHSFSIKVRKSFTPNPVFIDGISRSGKAAIAVTLASLDRTEHVETRNIIDRIFSLYSLGLLEKNAAIDNLITEIDFNLWFNYLGRNLNSNIHDFTSVLNSRDPEMYKSRMKNHDNNDTFRAFKNFLLKTQPITLDCVDEMVYDSEIFFEAFPNTKIIVVLRHPIDIAFAWHRTGRGGNYGSDQKTIHPTFNVGEITNVPAFALDWAHEYHSIKPIDRVAKTISTLCLKYYDYLDNIDSTIQDKILIIPFEHFVTKPEKFLKKLCSFIGTEVTSVTEAMMGNANIPRVLNKVNFSKKFMGLKTKMSKNYFNELINVSNIYESTFNPPFRNKNIIKDIDFDFNKPFDEYFTKKYYSKGKRLNN